MILDERTEMADNVALNTGGAGRYVLGDQLDVAPLRDLGNSGPLYVVAVVTGDAAGGSNSKLSLEVVTDNVAPPATNGTATTHITFGPVAVADLKAGTMIGAVPLPSGAMYERYMGVLQKTEGAAFTAGKVSVFLTPTPDTWRAYKDAMK